MAKSNGKIETHLATNADINMIVDMRMLFSDELVGKQDATEENSLRHSLLRYFAEELNKTCLCWYATADNIPVSIVTMILRKQPGSIVNPTGMWGYVMNVFTLPEYRRQGISSILLNKIIDHAVGLGYTAFELHATKDGEPAYLKLGFNKHTEPTYRKFVVG